MKGRVNMNKPQSNLEYTKGYGKNYANLRKKEYNNFKDFSVRELSKEINIAPSTISQIENEKREPTVEQVMIYKHFFNVSLDYLVGETKIANAVLQAFCEFTGLSEDTVLKLRDCGKYEGGSNILNKLLLDLPTICNLSAETYDIMMEYHKKRNELYKKLNEIQNIDERFEITKQIDGCYEFIQFLNWKRKNMVTEIVLKSLDTNEEGM